MTELDLLELGLLVEDLDVFSVDRNPCGTRQVAALVFVVDRRDEVLYEECTEIRERIEEVTIEADTVVAKVERVMSGRRKSVKAPEPKGDETTRRCKVCGGPVDGNRKDECHACSRLGWEDEPGKGGRHASKLNAHFQAEREALVERTQALVIEARKENEALVKKLRNDVSAARLEAEQRQEDAHVLALLIELAQENPQSDFAQAFSSKLRLARDLSAKGFVKPEPSVGDVP
jgi:hypothetical protein